MCRVSCSYGRGGERGAARPEVLKSLLSTTSRIVQQIDSVEYGMTDIQVRCPWQPVIQGAIYVVGLSRRTLAVPHLHTCFLGSPCPTQEYYANTGALARAAQMANGQQKVGVSIVEAFGKVRVVMLDKQ